MAARKTPAKKKLNKKTTHLNRIKHQRYRKNSQKLKFFPQFQKIPRLAKKMLTLCLTNWES